MALAMPGAASAGVDWPKYRYDLVNTGFNPGETAVGPSNVSQLKLAWAANQHYGASPVVVNGVIYLQCQASGLTSPPTPEECAVNAATGQVIWHTHIGTTNLGSTATVSGGVVYVGGSRPTTMNALNATTGALLWSTKAPAGFDVHTATPVVANGIVYMSFDDGLLHAYNAVTGAELWSVFFNSADTTPALVNNVLYVEGGSPGDAYGGQPSLIGILYAVDAVNGHVLWKSWSQYGYAFASPAVANGLVYVATSNDNSHLNTNLLAYSASGCGAALCKPVWEVGEPSTPFSAPAYWNGVVYEGFADGYLYAVDASNGKFLWKGATGLQAPYGQWAVEGAPVIANGVVYGGSKDGYIYAWNASGCGQSTCAAVWKASADLQDPSGTAEVATEPAIVNGTLYVTSTDWYLNLYAFNLTGPAPTPTPTPTPTPDNRNQVYTLDGWGGVHANGNAPVLASGGYWPNWDIARGLALFADGSGGYMLDGWGGVHPVGKAPAIRSSGYWPNWDIARAIVLAPWASAGKPDGWILDGWGGLHAFGAAPAIRGNSYWPNWDIARGVVILPDSSPISVAGYVLDGWGGVHPFGDAPSVNGPLWPNWDIARGITLLPGRTRANPGGYVLDGWGGVHPFGSAPAVSGTAFWPNWDIARGIVSWTGAPAQQPGGWTVDGWGGVHAFGSAPAVVSHGYWPNWDIVRGFSSSGGGSGGRHH